MISMLISIKLNTYITEQRRQKIWKLEGPGGVSCSNQRSCVGAGFVSKFDYCPPAFLSIIINGKWKKCFYQADTEIANLKFSYRKVLIGRQILKRQCEPSMIIWRSAEYTITLIWKTVYVSLNILGWNNSGLEVFCKPFLSASRWLYRWHCFLYRHRSQLSYNLCGT